MAERIIEEAESIVAGEAMAIQVNPSFGDVCVLYTGRINQLIGVVDEINAVVAEVMSILSSIPEEPADG